MNLGIALPNFGAYADVRLLADIAKDAEAHGWDGVFLADTVHFSGYEDAPVVNPWMALTAMAFVTTRITLGTRVSAPTRRRVHQLALEALTLDQVSGGRAVLGVGLGDAHDHGFAALGEEMDARRRAAMLDEMLEVIDRFWTGDPVTFQGEHVLVDHVRMLPRPVRRPRLPIWVGWLWPNAKPLDRAARWDGATPFALAPDGAYRDITPDETRDLARAIADRRTTDTPYDIEIDGPVLHATSDPAARRALADLRDAGATWSLEFVPPEVSPESLREILRRGKPTLP